MSGFDNSLSITPLHDHITTFQRMFLPLLDGKPTKRLIAQKSDSRNMQRQSDRVMKNLGHHIKNLQGNKAVEDSSGDGVDDQKRLRLTQDLYAS